MHIKEGVPWKDIEFADNQVRANPNPNPNPNPNSNNPNPNPSPNPNPNQPAIELLEKPPQGILRLLDSQCKAPKANDETYMAEVNKLHAKSESPLTLTLTLTLALALALTLALALARTR